MRRSLFSVLVLLLALGCGSSTPSARTDTMIDFTGMATLSGGKPAANLTIQLLPSTKGTLQTQVATDKDGKFKGQAFAGDYLFFFEEGKNVTAYNSLPTKYKQASEEHKVTVKADEPVTIAVK
jgi:hypothetical protein